MAQLSIEARSLLRLLDDGEWHPLNETLIKLATTVAPGKALRRYDSILRSREATSGPRRTPELTMVEQMSSGARSIATDTYHSLKKRYLEIKDSGDGRFIRRRDKPLPAAVAPRRVETLDFEQLVDAQPIRMDQAEETAFAEVEPVLPAPTEGDTTAVLRQVIAEEVDRAVEELRRFIAEQLTALTQFQDLSETGRSDAPRF